MQEIYGPLLDPGDLIADKVDVTGTTYRRDQIVVTSVNTADLITVGVILDIVVRKNRLLFIVDLHDAIRAPFRFFQACPCDKVQIIDYHFLCDFKPLYKRDRSINFSFFLHHHIPTPLS
jgi:adenylate kinase